jgi:hypothetical protein
MMSIGVGVGVELGVVSSIEGRPLTYASKSRPKGKREQKGSGTLYPPHTRVFLKVK